VNILDAHIVIEGCCLLTALICLRRVKGWWGWFRAYMVAVVVIELAGAYLWDGLQLSTYPLYNFGYLPLYFCFSSFLLYRLCRPLFKIQPWISIITVLIFASYLVENMVNRFNALSVKTFLLANISYIVICCCYFYYLLKDEAFVDIKRHPPFWIIAGLLFFCFGSTANYLFYDILKEVYLKHNILLRYYLMILVNFLLYGCWSYAFLCKYREMK